MQLAPPSLIDMLKNGVIISLERWQLLIMLAVLYGILSTIALWPSQEAANTLFSISGEDKEVTAQQAAALSDGITTIFFGLLPAVFFNAALLMLWTRITARKGLIPNEGGLSSFFKRSIRCFRHIIVAAVLSLTILFTIGLVIVVVSTALGPLGLGSGSIKFI